MFLQATRHARRVYVGGLSPQANEHVNYIHSLFFAMFQHLILTLTYSPALQSVATFFSQVMAAVGGNTAGPGDAVVNVYINHEKKFAFGEMRFVEEASNAISLNEIIFEVCFFNIYLSTKYFFEVLVFELGLQFVFLLFGYFFS